MDLPADDHLTRSVTELGDPEALFGISRTRFLAKFALGVLLLLYGVGINYFWWFHPQGPATFGYLEIFILFLIPLSGGYMLLHMYRERGLYVLIYPTGLLRLRRGEVASFPWREVAFVRLKVQKAANAEIVRDPDGSLVTCWLPAEVPTFQLWNASLTVAREDGIVVHFSPALTDYDVLAEEVQKRTFAVAWPLIWAGFLEGKVIEFGDLELSRAGMRHGGKFLPWQDVKELSVAQGRLSIKQGRKWLPWVLMDVTTIPNPHLLFALASEAQRWAAPSPLLGQPKHKGDE